MPTIVARGKPELVDMTDEFGGRVPGGGVKEGQVTLSFGMWCTTDEGKSYVYYVDITPKDQHPRIISGADRVWPDDVQETLGRLQAAFEKNPSTHGRPSLSPVEDIDRMSRELKGMDEAEHEQIHKDWQRAADWAVDPGGQRKEREHDYSGAQCWCGGRGGHGGQSR